MEEIILEPLYGVQDREREEKERLVSEIPALRQELEDWKMDLAELEKTPGQNPEKLIELKQSISDLTWEIGRREKMR
jgi:chromosome segregation ATPase